MVLEISDSVAIVDGADSLSEREKDAKPWSHRLDSLAWTETFDLDSVQGLRSFLREVVKRTWTGELGTRQAAAINVSVKMLLVALTAQLLGDGGKRKMGLDEAETKILAKLDKMTLDDRDKLFATESTAESADKVEPPVSGESQVPPA